MNRIKTKQPFEGENFSSNTFCDQGIGNKESGKEDKDLGRPVFKYVCDHLKNSINWNIKKRKLVIINQCGSLYHKDFRINKEIIMIMFMMAFKTVETATPNTIIVEAT